MNINNADVKRPKAEPTIALINIVFLMLIFFLVAAQIASPLDPDLELVSTKDIEQSAPPSHLVIHADGSTTFQGNVVSIDNYVTGLSADETEQLRIIPDRNVPAVKLVDIANQLKTLGVKRIYLVTERRIKENMEN